MTKASTLILLAAAIVYVPTPLHAQDLARYRDFVLGSTVASVIKATGMPAGDVKMIHQRPVTIQELRWQPPQLFTASAMHTDPLREIVFRFYNDQLFLMTVDYDRQRTEGLTDADLIESMTPLYGVPILKTTTMPMETPLAALDHDVVVARWIGPESSVSLRRGTYPTTLRLTVALTHVEALATTASTEADLRDAQEAPQREIDRRERDAEARRIAVERARIANKSTFKP